MTNDTPIPPFDEQTREDIYNEECKQVMELMDASTTMQTVLENALPIEPAGSHIDQRNKRVKEQLERAKNLLNSLEQLHDELQRR